VAEEQAEGGAAVLPAKAGDRAAAQASETWERAAVWGGLEAGEEREPQISASVQPVGPTRLTSAVFPVFR
jgi:hypothetical protein